MKNCFLILFLAFTIQLSAEIPVGLTSNNIFTWSVWENDKGVLKHYLYIYNKTKKEIKLQIKLKKFKPNGEEMNVDKEIYKTFLAPTRITKLDYPTTTDKLSYMNFFEDGKTVGVIAFNMEEPQRSFVDNKFRFYTNAGVNASKGSVWMRIESIYNVNSEIGFTTLIKNDTDVFLLKITDANTGDANSYLGKLDSLKQTDATILKLEQAGNQKSGKLKGDLGAEKFTFIPIVIETVQNGKKAGEQIIQLPLFKE